MWRFTSQHIASALTRGHQDRHCQWGHVLLYKEVGRLQKKTTHEWVRCNFISWTIGSVFEKMYLTPEIHHAKWKKLNARLFFMVQADHHRKWKDGTNGCSYSTSFQLKTHTKVHTHRNTQTQTHAHMHGDNWACTHIIQTHTHKHGQLTHKNQTWDLKNGSRPPKLA